MDSQRGWKLGFGSSGPGIQPEHYTRSATMVALAVDVSHEVYTCQGGVPVHYELRGDRAVAATGGNNAAANSSATR